MSLTRAWRQAAIMRSQSASERASGFSQTTCLPARAAASVTSAWRSLGQPRTTISTSLDRKRSRSANACRTPCRAANAAAFPGVGDVTAKSSAPATRFRDSAWTVEMKPDPTSPTLTCLMRTSRGDSPRPGGSRAMRRRPFLPELSYTSAVDRRVAVAVDASRSYGRGLLLGIGDFIERRGGWSTYVELHADGRYDPG